jgi:CheY-like chemotaxis protein
MSKARLLLADSDPRSLRILELALRRAGFEVEAVADGPQALEKLLGAGIEVAVCDAALPPPDGIALCRAARAEQRLAAVPFVLVGEDRTPAAKTRALEAGADDYIPKPVLLKELVQRVQHLLDRRRLSDPPASPLAMTGSVHDLGLVDVLQSLETWKKSAVVRCENAGQLARIWVCDGEVVDAELGPLAGEAAFWRVMTWDAGTYRVEFADTELRQARIHGGTQAALVEAMRRMDELGRIGQKLPMDAQLAVDVEKLAEHLADLPDEVNAVLRHFDGARSLRAAIDLAPLDDLATVDLVQRLLGNGILRMVPARSPSQQWIAPETRRHRAAERIAPRILRFPPSRGVRRQRLRRETEQVRAQIAAGEPVRLHRVVELPAREESESLGELRRISDAVGEAAKKLAPDVALSRVTGAAAVPPIAPVVESTPPPQLAGRRRRRWPWVLAAIAGSFVVIGVFGLQPHTERKDAPWLDMKAPAATPQPRAAALSTPPAVAPSVPPEAAGYGEAMARGSDLFRQGKYRAAAAEYGKAVGIRPEAVPALIALGDAWLEADRPRSALEPLDAAARLDPKAARAHLLLGTAYQSLGKKGEAAKAYRRFLDLEPASEYAKDVRVILANLGG